MQKAISYHAATAGLLAIAATALFLRLYAAGDNFWLDEVIVYFLAWNEAHSLRDIFLRLNIEHHLLVTFWVRLSGDRLDWFWYRLPSVLTGTGLVILASVIAERRMRKRAALLVAAMTAVSYPLVVFSSEARGYAPAAFFSLLSFLAVDSWMEKRQWTALAGFWIAMVLALLCHSTAVFVFIALGLWSLAREFRKDARPVIVVPRLALCCGVPFLFFTFLYFSIMRKWQTMGGDILPLQIVIGDALSLAMGVPMDSACPSLVMATIIILVVMTMWLLGRRLRSDTWIFYLGLLIVAPAMVFLSSNRQYVYVRYFAVMFPFFYLMLGECFDKLAQESRILRVGAVLMATLIIAGNAYMTRNFLLVGRGGYLDAVSYMAENTSRAIVTVGGDHDFRNETMVAFYRRYLPQDRRMYYIKQADWPAEGPDWIINQSNSMEDYVPKQNIRAKGGNYRLVRSYASDRLSGQNWYIYRNETKFARDAE